MSWQPVLSAMKAYVDRRVAALRLAQRLVVRSVSAAGRLAAGGVQGEELSDLELAQHYGLRSRPASGSAIGVQLGGVGGRWVAVAEVDAAAPTVAAGEVCLYTSSGAKVLLRASGAVEITPATGQPVTLAGGVAAVARVGDAVTVTGTVTVGGTALPIVATGAIAAGNPLVLA